MKATLLLIFFLIVYVPASFAQKALMERSFEPGKLQGSLKYFLNEIHIQTGVLIEYATNVLDESQQVKLDGNEKTIAAVLQKILQHQSVRVLEKNGKILLVPFRDEQKSSETVTRHVVYGVITMSGSKEPLADATIIEPSTGIGTLANPYGYFNLSLPAGKHTLLISYIGFIPQTVELELQESTRQDIALSLLDMPSSTVIVNSYNLNKEGVEKINTDQYAAYNMFLGENDPLRAAYLLPGVKNVPESFNGILVRGGGSNENAFLLDGNPIFNPTHMLGALSIVVPTSLKTMRLYKSDFPARFGGAISSVIDVYTKDGDLERWRGEANVGFLAGSFSVEGPLVKDKTALMASVRRSWPEYFLKHFQKGIQPDFYDAHIKLTHHLSKKDKLMLNFYTGKDEIRQFKKRIDDLHKWGNLTGSLSWNHMLGARSFINTSVNFSRYDNLGSFQYNLFDSEEEEKLLQTKSLGTYSYTGNYDVKSKGEIHLSNAVKINTGFKFSHTISKPFEKRISNELQENKSAFTSFDPLPFNEFSLYAEAEIRIGKKLFIRPGLHTSFYQFQNYQFKSLQPRMFASWQIGNRHHLFLSYNTMTQYLHLVTNPYLGANSDIWVPSTSILKPEQSYSYNIGYSFKKGKAFRFSIDAYKRKMYNVTNYAEGKSYFINSNNWQQNIETGEGESHGIETLIEKNSERISFHAAYTLAWSFRKFQSINDGLKFPYKYDRRHDFNLGLSYKFGKKFNVMALWSFATGDMYTLPDQMYPDFDIAQQIQTPDDMLKDYRFIYLFSGVNQYRTDPFHRLDFALNYHSKPDKKLKSQITAGVYNLYGSPDQYSYDFKGSYKTKKIVINVSDQTFNITPYISYTLKF